MSGRNCYTREELFQLVRELERLFNLVRILDPASEEQLVPKVDGSLEREPWEELYILMDTPDKREISECRPVHALSRPLILEENGKEFPLVLELAGEVPARLVERRRGYYSLEKTAADREELYRDELTQVFNRRYLRDFIFLNRNLNQITRLGIVMLDLRRFKAVNDTFGHLVGDHTLEQVARVLQAHIESQGAVIRMGGDEFVIILLDCEEGAVCQKVAELREALSPVAEADFGYAYTERFTPSLDLLRALVEQADRCMYQEKRHRY